MYTFSFTFLEIALLVSLPLGYLLYRCYSNFMRTITEFMTMTKNFHYEIQMMNTNLSKLSSEANKFQDKVEPVMQAMKFDSIIKLGKEFLPVYMNIIKSVSSYFTGGKSSSPFDDY